MTTLPKASPLSGLPGTDPPASNTDEPKSLRQRLPNRRECFTETLLIGNALYDASVGFDDNGEPKEIFLSGAKTGTDMAAVLADTGVLVSITLQSGIPAELLAPSMSRIPGGWAGWTEKGEPTGHASVLGAALDLVARYEAEDWR